MKDCSIGIDEETAIKARRCSARTHESIAELVRRYFASLDKLIKDLPESARVSITDFEINLATFTIRQQVQPIFGLTDLPLEIQKQVKKAFGYGANNEDLREKKVET
jgi:hypothetical protein